MDRSFFRGVMRGSERVAPFARLLPAFALICLLVGSTAPGAHAAAPEPSAFCRALERVNTGEVDTSELAELEGHAHVIGVLLDAAPKKISKKSKIPTFSQRLALQVEACLSFADGLVDSVKDVFQPTASSKALKKKRNAVRYGFDDSEMQAIRGLTIVPAMAGGIDDRLGSLEVGKDADILQITGHPADPRSWIKRVWVNGGSVYDTTEDRRRW